jgi:hypothetical protein
MQGLCKTWAALLELVVADHRIAQNECLLVC